VETLGRLALFAVFAVGFLGSVAAFAAVRLRQADARGDRQRYVPHADPWLPLVQAAVGAAALALLSVFR
jgi:hypothetical protein